MTANKKIPRTIRNGVTVVSPGSLYESIEEKDIEPIEIDLMEALETAESPQFIVDMSGIRFFGSSFIEVMFRLWQRLQKTEGGRFALASLSPYCREVLEIARLDQLWEVVDSVDQAVESMQQA